MRTYSSIIPFSLALIALFVASTFAAEPAAVISAQTSESDGGKVHVSPDNFRRAETDFMFKKKVDDGYFGKVGHVRGAVSIDNQLVIRMNRDTLYSFGVFDLTEPVTIIKPDTGRRFQSMLVINEDHYIKVVAYDPGEYLLTREKIGTRYVQVAFRTLVDPNDPGDVKVANAIQDKILVRQSSPGSFEIPDWDEASREKVANGLKLMGSTLGAHMMISSLPLGRKSSSLPA